MTQRTCHQCQVDLRPIQVVVHLPGQGYSTDMQYASVQAKRNPWSGEYPFAGRVHALGCPGCGQVFFYAERKVDRLPIPSTASETPKETLPLPSEGPDPDP